MHPRASGGRLAGVRRELRAAIEDARFGAPLTSSTSSNQEAGRPLNRGRLRGTDVSFPHLLRRTKSRERERECDLQNAKFRSTPTATSKAMEWSKASWAGWTYR